MKLPFRLLCTNLILFACKCSLTVNLIVQIVLFYFLEIKISPCRKQNNFLLKFSNNKKNNKYTYFWILLDVCLKPRCH